jgi:PAS domain S-box-containing protein
MGAEHLKILIVEDEAAHAEAISRAFEAAGRSVEIRVAGTLREYCRFAAEIIPDVALMDLNLPDGRATEALTFPPENGGFPILIMTAYGNEQMAVEALKAGALDYVVKSPEAFTAMPRVAERAMREWKLLQDNRRAYDALRESEDKYRHIVENLGKEYLFYRHDTDGFFNYVSPSITDMLGYSRQEALSHYSGFLSGNPVNKEVAGRTALSIQGLQQPSYEVEIVHKNGSLRWLEVTEYPVRNQDGSVVAVEGIARDITEHKNADKSQQASLRFLKTVHKHTEITPLLDELASEIKDYTGCDSVAIRVLDEEGNIPYHAYKGFSRKFVEMESPLSVHSDQCMCINVIKGTTNPRLPFYTEGGSFYMNGTTRFLATVPEEEKGKTRNICNREGYESVALVPFRSGGRILGLIHVADRRENMVPLKMVEQLESVALQLGTAFQRANAEYALRKSEERYRTLFDNMLEGYAYCKMLYTRDTPQDFVYVHVNKAFEALTGLKNVTGKKVSEVIPGIQESNPELFRFYGRVALTGKPERFETYVASMGIWFSIAAYGTEKEHFAAVFDNITERKLAEEALRASEHQYRQLVDNALVGVYRSTPEGKFLYVNDALAGIFECENADEMLQLPVEMRYKKPEDREAFLNIIKEKGKVPYYEIEVPVKSGRLKTIVISAALEDGIITGMVTDITERRHLEAQLRHAQKMEAVGTLAGGIAHDFNNILNVIIGYGKMVQGKMEADSPSMGHMNEVLAAAERAGTLTRRLLAFSRKQAVAMKPINVNELIANIQTMLARIIGEDIDFNLDLSDRLLAVMADAGQIEQVLMNLAANARDAMPKGGRLTIGTGVKEIDDEYVAVYGYGEPGMYAVITVSDTGDGIDAETQKKIFEPFFTTKGIGEGTGLGLAISYGIIKQHSGYIKVYSEPGQGTLFKIYLPLIEGPASLEKEAETRDSVKGGSETILVAEDDSSLRKLSVIVLESLGYHVITAEDGEVAIAKFMENRDRIDLVLLDMIMPKKNGKEVSEVIRKVSPRTKILFASGYTMNIIQTRELTESGFDFILKPVQPKDLLRKVREILDR